MEGVFSRKVDALLQALIILRVHIEAAIDFPEEEIDFLADPAIARQLETLRVQLVDLLREARRGVRLNDGLRIAIVGRPNAGKSSLLNALAGSERAIVTDIAGTTRDVVRESITLDGVALELADTAGLRDTHDPVESEGVRRAHSERERADAVLLVTDAQHADADLAWLKDLPAGVERIVVINKIDLDDKPAHTEQHADAKWLWLSVKTGEGLEVLRDYLKQLAGSGSGEGAFSARRRHVLALELVEGHLTHAANVLANTRAGELAAEELRQAQHALGEITGTYTSDDLLGAIFSSFCIGK
jgi:tRNA modification GTPase